MNPNFFQVFDEANKTITGNFNLESFNFSLSYLNKNPLSELTRAQKFHDELLEHKFVGLEIEDLILYPGELIKIHDGKKLFEEIPQLKLFKDQFMLTFHECMGFQLRVASVCKCYFGDTSAFLVCQYIVKAKVHGIVKIPPYLQAASKRFRIKLYEAQIFDDHQEKKMKNRQKNEESCEIVRNTKTVENKENITVEKIRKKKEKLDNFNKIILEIVDLLKKKYYFKDYIIEHDIFGLIYQILKVTCVPFKKAHFLLYQNKKNQILNYLKQYIEDTTNFYCRGCKNLIVSADKLRWDSSLHNIRCVNNKYKRSIFFSSNKILKYEHRTVDIDEVINDEDFVYVCMKCIKPVGFYSKSNDSLSNEILLGLYAETITPTPYSSE